MSGNGGAGGRILGHDTPFHEVIGATIISRLGTINLLKGSFKPQDSLLDFPPRGRAFYADRQRSKSTHLPSMSIQNIFFGKTNSTRIQLLRYTFVGGAAFALDFSVLVLLTELFGVHYLVSAGAGFLMGLLANYVMSVAWVFQNRVYEDRRKEFALFALIGVVGLGLNELFLYLFTDLAGFHYIYSKIMTTGLVYFWNFGARKLALFR